MPQLNKGGKFVFGKSLVRDDMRVRFPPLAVEEYGICREKRVYLFTGAKATGGFCVTRKGLLLPSEIGNILTDNPELCGYGLPEGEFIAYKGRKYCWAGISEDGTIQLSWEMLDMLELTPGMVLMSVRSSDIAFTMAAKGPLLERAKNYAGTIEVY